MLKLFRIVVVTVLAMLISIVGSLYALVRLRYPDSVSVVANMFGSLHKWVGVKLITRNKATFNQPAIYI